MALAAAQLSFLVGLGMRPDADDATAENFARTLADHELAEFERISDETLDAEPIARVDETDEADTVTDPAPAPIARSEPTTSGTTDVAAEIQRELDRRNVERQARLAFIREQSSDDVPRDLVERAMAEDWSESRVATEFLRAVRTRPAPVGGGHVAIHSRSHATDCSTQALQGAMLLRSGFSLDDAMFARREASAMLRRDGVGGAWLHSLASTPDSIQRQDGSQDEFLRARDNAHRYANLSLVDFCREGLRLAGRPVPDDNEDMIRRALSTATLSSVFSTSVNMQILASYLGIEDTTRGWVMETDNADFKQIDRGRLTKGSGLKKLARGQEANPIEFGDAIESYKLARYAGKFEIDEQDIIDDSFGGITGHTPQELGELAAELRPNLVYAIILANAVMRDSVALFHADHGNLEASSALSATTLKTAKANMMVQTENGRSIRNAMRYLVVPANLEFTARQLVTSAELRETGGAALSGTANPHQGTLSVVVDPRLDNGVTDPDTGTAYAGSETTWFGAAASGRTGIEIGYRRGTGRAPRMDTYMLSGARWGMGWKCNMDIGGKAIDWRGLHKATA